MRQFQTLEADWEASVARWLPVDIESSLWRFSRGSQRDLPRQGWKLHVSATIVSAGTALEAVGPFLDDRDVVFKGPSSLLTLKRLNCGLFYGYVQVGKFLTVYPRDDEEAATLARRLDELTRTFEGPAVPFEQPVAPGSSVFTRYGAFGAHQGEDSTGSVRAPDGELVPDRRDRNPDWAVCPPALIRRRPPAAELTGRLATTFRAYEALSQRGKGGVYKALDLTTRPARRCVLKEGRLHGEVDLDESDGRSRVHQELEVLRCLEGTSVQPPRVYEHFEEGGHAYLALEWIEGEPLHEVLHPDRDLLSVEAALDLAWQCASLVADLHDEGWIWRDLKAANLILSNGRLRPVDFEGAVQVGAHIASPWGSGGYLPPEWTELGKATFAQDRYALGVVVHQLFTNIIPEADRAPSAVEAVRGDVPPLVSKVIARLTSEDPRDRISADAARDQLQTLRAEWPQTITAHSPAVLPAAPS